MQRAKSTTGFYTKGTFEIPYHTNDTAKNWESNHMYTTSYYKMSEKNQNALKNSTEQLLKTKSSRLKEISPQQHFFTKNVDNTDFINHDYYHHYRTSYNDMSRKEPKLLNKHYIPRYAGFVPGMKSENPFAKTVQSLSKENIQAFNSKRFSTISGFDSNALTKSTSDSFNPLSKSIGKFSARDFVSTQKTLEPHEFTTKLKESGYTNNIASYDKTGWIPHPNLHSDMIRSEYRININPPKGIHYKGPLFSTGALKKKEFIYKHT